MVTLLRAARRSISTVDDYIQAVQYGGNTYTVPQVGSVQTMPGQARERVSADLALIHRRGLKWIF
ncbi:hypothetical protein ACWDA7_52015 [Streptomyces sp. NPDC001156]